jgi:predicted phage terminase large subunit-like protein
MARKDIEASLEADLDAELLYRARRDILAFTTYTKPDYQICWHHRKLAAKLNAFVRGDIPFLMVSMPPRHGKSELVSRRLPAFIHGIMPDAEIMAASYLDSLANEMTRDVQRIMTSPEYHRIFPKTNLPKLNTNSLDGYRNTSGHSILGMPNGKYRGQGVGGSYTGKGASFALVDDPIKGRNVANSEAFREQLWNFWLNDLYSRLETNLKTGKRGQALITMTRWHEDDLSGRLLDIAKKDPLAIQWEVVHFPAIREDMDNPDDPRAIGEALWPAKFTIEHLKQIRAATNTTPRAWSAVWQQNPVPGDGVVFNENMFQFVDMPKTFHWTFITADTSYKEKQENDFTVFTSFGVIDDTLFVRDVWRQQVKAADVEHLVEPFIRRNIIEYGCRGTWIEPKGHGIYLNQKWALKGLMIPSQSDLEEFYSDRHIDKVERAANAVPHLANRKIYINKLLANKEALVAECLGFPNGKHDDFVDTLVDGIKKVYWRELTLLDVL